MKKLKTRLFMAFLMILILPVFLISTLVFGLSKYQMYALSKTLGLEVTYDNLSDNANLVSNLTTSYVDSLAQQINTDKSKLLDPDYLSELNSELKEKYSALVLRVDGQILYSGLEDDLFHNGKDKILEELPQYKGLEDDKHNGIYLGDKIRVLVKQHDFLTDDQQPASLFIVTSSTALIPHIRTVVIELLLAAVIVLALTSMCLLVWIYNSIKSPLTQLKEATNKIKSNKLEVEKRQKDIINETFRNDFFLINEGVTDIDFEKMISNPVYKNDPEKILKLKKVFNTYRESKQNDLQTVIDLEDGLMLNPDKSQKKRLDYAFERLSKELGDYTQFESSAQSYAEKTNYIPSAFVGKINNMFNSSDPREREVAAKSWYNVKMNNPQATSSMSNSQSDLLFAYGAGLHQNISLSKLEEQLGAANSDNVIKDREKKLKDIAKKGIKLDLDVEDIVAKQKSEDIFSSWYMQTGDESVAREMAENWVNSNYGITRIGLGKSQPGYLFDTSALYDWTYPEKEIYQPAELMYSVKDLDEDKNILWLADDLLMTAREVVPDIKYEDIRYTNDLMYDENNKPIYLMTNKDGIILGRWKPDYVNYRKKKKDLENK